jgi:hypothetical protein
VARIVITRPAPVADPNLSPAAQRILDLLLAQGHGATCATDSMALSRLSRANGGKLRPSSARNMRLVIAELENAGYILRRLSSGSGMEVQVSDDPAAGWDDFYSPGLELLRPGHCVYVVAAQGLTLAKIGTTRNIKSRFATLQGGSPVPLDLRSTYPGGYLLEAFLHHRFASIRAHGEWFDFGQEDPAEETARAVEEYRLRRDAA